jgi:hypothetical protein
VDTVHLKGDALWQAYTTGKQTYAQLADEYGCSTRTIQRKLSTVAPRSQHRLPSQASVIVDTTYFGRSFGVLTLMDSSSGQVLYKRYVDHETTAAYVDGVRHITLQGVKVQAIICDGRKGVMETFSRMGIPVQMCQFHQEQIVLRYLTRHPKMAAAQALRKVTLMLSTSNEQTFAILLQAWHERYYKVVEERGVNKYGKTYYRHKKLRSAYRSLINHLPYLFTFEHHPELSIPNTTNKLDGRFGMLKNRLRNHNGLSLAHKKKFIDDFLQA